MKKKTLVASFGLMVSSLTFAGGLLTNTNQNVTFLRNPARDGAIGIDGVYSNPAGVAFLPDGLHLSLNFQSAYQTREVTSVFGPFAYGAGNRGESPNCSKEMPKLRLFLLCRRLTIVAVGRILSISPLAVEVESAPSRTV